MLVCSRLRHICFWLWWSTQGLDLFVSGCVGLLKAQTCLFLAVLVSLEGEGGLLLLCMLGGSVPSLCMLGVVFLHFACWGVFLHFTCWDGLPACWVYLQSLCMLGWSSCMLGLSSFTSHVGMVFLHVGFVLPSLRMLGWCSFTCWSVLHYLMIQHTHTHTHTHTYTHTHR